VVKYVRSAPLTFTWLALLLVTTVIQRQMGKHQLNLFLSERSTNVHNLVTDPLRVIFESLLWLDGAYWVPYAIGFAVILAPAERWLGWWRWLTVGLAGHIVATYVSEGMLAYRISHDHPEKRYLVHVTDIGVSYYMAAILGVLAWRFTGWKRWLIALGGAVGFASSLVIWGPNFTRLGHVVAFLVGLSMLWFVPVDKRGQLASSRSKSVRKSSGSDVDGSTT
jgi:hypothetical protein